MANDLSSTTPVSFSKQMRLATRDIHKISDALVNAKIAFGKYKIENENFQRQFQTKIRILTLQACRTTMCGRMDLKYSTKYHRTAAFESDLAFYLGDNWHEEYSVRESVHKYLHYLEELKDKNPKLLIAYVYHLYMGLLSGGQILQKKRKLMNNIVRGNDEGCAVTTFDGCTIGDLKNRMRNLVDDLAGGWDEEIRTEIIKESRRVFELNNEIVSTVEGAGQVALFKIGIAVLVVVLAYCCFRIVK